MSWWNRKDDMKRQYAGEGGGLVMRRLFSAEGG
jgi:hypothetical protein